MSLEQSIADLQAQAVLLLDLPQEIADAADAKITSLTDTFNAKQDKMQVMFYVDRAVGLDTNEGTEAALLKTIQKALDLTPHGGTCNVRLLADYLISDSDIEIVNRLLFIFGANATKRNLQHEPYIRADGGTNYKDARKFLFNRGGALAMTAMNWIVPPNPAGGGRCLAHGAVTPSRPNAAGASMASPLPKAR